MTDEHFEQQLQQQFQHSKQQHPLPATVKRSLLKVAKQRQRPDFAHWWRYGQLALGCAVLTVTAYLMSLPVTMPGYQIVVSHSEHYQEIEQHLLTSRSVPAVVAPFSTDNNQQRYQQLIAAQQQTTQFYAQVGQLDKTQPQWQIKVCDELLISLDASLIAALQQHDQSMSTLQQDQWVEFRRGQSGQILAIVATGNTLQCPHS